MDMVAILTLRPVLNGDKPRTWLRKEGLRRYEVVSHPCPASAVNASANPPLATFRLPFYAQFYAHKANGSRGKPLRAVVKL